MFDTRKVLMLWNMKWKGLQNEGKLSQSRLPQDRLVKSLYDFHVIQLSDVTLCN